MKYSSKDLQNVALNFGIQKFHAIFNNPIIYALVFVLMAFIKKIEELNKKHMGFLIPKVRWKILNQFTGT